ncbi:hypothetical protein [Rheinheimera sp. 4Y26]|uniref:hypothetical protein n=1 Tax=Rheinheimera sp. 4Y26 TaxID=2977811 RepID=UPI0021B11E0B|nr:hypothetical protein [Rheinheimera sp. 4Y26]MCT6700345.1 hypothetical protein [Rheinheimera sp. 4Y26]
MNFETFFDRVKTKQIVVNMPQKVSSEQETLPNQDMCKQPVGLLDNEALFQLPLICIIILVMAKDRRKPKVAELGQLVGECIESSFVGFKGSAQHIGWSANLRIRTVTALGFLESTGLIIVNNRKDRLQITELGKKVVERAMNWNELLEYNIAFISRSYRNICVSRQLDLELE